MPLKTPPTTAKIFLLYHFKSFYHVIETLPTLIMFLGPAEPISPGDLLDMQSFRAHRDATKLESEF